jgi:hypothetical protein
LDLSGIGWSFGFTERRKIKRRRERGVENFLEYNYGLNTGLVISRVLAIYK